MTSAGLLAFVVAATSVAAAQQGGPRFQASVDVTSVDVAVVDGSGRPIASLTPGDFTVRVDGVARRVVSAEWVGVASDAKSRAAGPPAPEGYSSNENSGGGRLIVIAIDQPNIRFGGGTAVERAATGFIDQLAPSDRVAVVGFSPGAPNTSFLADFDRAKQTVSRMVGQKSTPQPMAHNIGLSEALAILHDMQGALNRVAARECGQYSTRSGAFQDCLTEVNSEAQQLGREAQEQGNVSIRGLNNLFASLKTFDAPKTVVLISEGFVVEDTEALATELGSMAAAARASLYVLHLDEQSFDMSSSRRTTESNDDRRARTVGLDALASAARGDVLNVSGSGASFFDRIQSEISGYYLLGIESDPRDRDGKAHPIRIEVPRRGAIVRSRRQMLDAAVADRRSPQQVVAAGLTSPLLLSALPLRVATFALQGPEPGKVQMLIHADIGNDYSASKAVSIGYAIFDQNGQVVDSQRSDGRLAPVLNGVPSALQFSAGASLTPGDYTLKLVAAEGDRAGSVEHRLHAKLADAGTVTLSELMVGGPATPGELLTPTIGYTVNFGSVHGYIEAYGPQADVVTVKYEIAADAVSNALIVKDVPGQLAGGERMIFTLVMPVAQLPPGRYVLRALVSAAARPLKTLTRTFEIAPPPVLMTSADGSASGAAAPELFLPVDERTFARPFLHDDPLKPDVQKLFRDRLAPTVKAAFEEGVASLTNREYTKAEASFKRAVQPDVDSTSALTYLAVTYAAAGHDLEAASAWQTALIDGADLPPIYDWLSQALLRTHSLSEARAVLEEANRKWPSDALFTGPLAAVYAMFGRGREAVRLLERYLESRTDDVEAARMGVEWMYQVHFAGAVVHNRAEDVTLARAWAARYGNGPQQALVRQWLDSLER